MRIGSTILAGTASLLMVDLAGAVDDWMGCDYRDFCSRHRDYILSELSSPVTDNQYSLDVGTIEFYQEKITATLTGAGHKDPLANEL